MNWFAVTETVALAVLVTAITLLFLLAARRRWLARQRGLFDCAARLSPGKPHGGWVLGVARYSGDNLEWYRAFSLSLRPRLLFPRSQTTVGHKREPSPDESLQLYEDQRVLQLRLESGEDWELGLSPASLTGLLSWLEASPPGFHYQ